MVYLEIGLIFLGAALVLLVLFCIPVLLKLWRAANDVAITLETLNERLPAILKNMEEISTNINHSTSAINNQVQRYTDTAQRFQLVIHEVVKTMELLSPLAIQSPVFRKMAALIPVIKGLKVFLKVLTERQKD